MEFSCINSGLPVQAAFPDPAVEGTFLPLLHRLTSIQRTKEGRTIVFLAAPPGAGKSTLARFLQVLSRTDPEIEPLQTLGMDGFHRYEKDLALRSILRNGERIPMSRVKGAPETFDLDRLTQAIRQVAAGGDIGWPEYSRTLHDPVENAVSVSGRLLLIEGNYLLLDVPGWRELKQYADYTIFLKADPEILRTRLTERKQAEGYSREEAVGHVEFSDMVNVKLCLEHSVPADLELTVPF